MLCRMLKYINYQLSDNAEQQQEIEKALSADIHRNLQQNLNAVRLHLPALIPEIEHHNIQRYSLFCTKNNELNIVEFGSGRTFYSASPRQEVMEELAGYYQTPSYFHLNAEHAVSNVQQPLPMNIDVMIVFGLGLGYHINELLTNCRIRYLIVYEPNFDMMLCSLQVNDWIELVEAANAKGTQLFFQMGSDATAIPSELAELLSFDPYIDKVYFYRHQFHPVMDAVVKFLKTHSGEKQQLTNDKQYFPAFNSLMDYVPERAENAALTWSGSNTEFTEQELYLRNLTVLERYYPAVYKEIKDYQPKKWTLVCDHAGKANLWHLEREALLHKDVDEESTELINYFAEHPFKDDVILGQRSGGKLWFYIHFRAVERLRPLLDSTLIKKGKLPKVVESMIVFGIGLGKHIELLLERYDVKKLYLCEPNLDFFYASLFVVDWEKIIKKFEQNNGRLYLNLGGDGSQYFHDLMAQFYQVGAYSIADTYMLTSYFNESMQKAHSDLRSELGVVLALGEYYDHARYGIAHTYHGIANGNRYMKADANKRLTTQQAERPIFVVGNGPSLDHLIPYIQEHRDRILLVSCGTALKSLYSHGIRPDFHAEIEQNRATYDWVMQVGDLDYLAHIYLISVNGIHPETSALFKETLLCFKEGEASTYVFNNGLRALGVESKQLAFAYPTVTNLVLNYFLSWGFKYFYLFGVDLGFLNHKNHHSKASAYYKGDGSQIYDYQAEHGGGLPVRGNFRDYVFAKPEFEVSRKLLEQVIAQQRGGIEVYNCNDGAYIKGAVPLQPENILITSAPLDREHFLEQLIEDTFTQIDPAFADKIYSKFNPDKFDSTMQSWFELFKDEFNDLAEAKEFIDKQWQLVRSKAVIDDEITFCVLYGSSNYISGILTKIASGIEEDESLLDTFNQVVAVWKDYLKEAHFRTIHKALDTDNTCIDYIFKTN